MTRKELSELARGYGYSIRKSADGYTLIDDRLIAAKYYFTDVTLDAIASFFRRGALDPNEPSRG